MAKGIVTLVGLLLAACDDPPSRAEPTAWDLETHCSEDPLWLVANRDYVELDKQIGSAVDAVVGAQNDADRACAAARLRQLQEQKWEIKARLIEARTRAGLPLSP